VFGKADALTDRLPCGRHDAIVHHSAPPCITSLPPSQITGAPLSRSGGGAWLKMLSNTTAVVTPPNGRALVASSGRRAQRSLVAGVVLYDFARRLLRRVRLRRSVTPPSHRSRSDERRTTVFNNGQPRSVLRVPPCA
jgi:hypothetical protein